MDGMHADEEDLERDGLTDGMRMECKAAPVGKDSFRKIRLLSASIPLICG
jgi:hypothetical protein